MGYEVKIVCDNGLLSNTDMITTIKYKLEVIRNVPWSLDSQGTWDNTTCKDTNFSTKYSCTTQGTWNDALCSDTKNAFSTEPACTTQGNWSDECNNTAYTTENACTTNGTWNSDAGFCSHSKYVYSSEIACTTVGWWNNTNGTCNVTNGGRDLNESACNATV